MGGLLDDLPNNASLHRLGLYLGFKLYNYASIVSNRVYQTFNPIPDGGGGGETTCSHLIGLITH